MEKKETYVGIDIAKAEMEIAVHGADEGRCFSNDDTGISEAVAWLKELSPALVVKK